MKIFRIIFLLIAVIMSSTTDMYSQLRKVENAAHVEKVKSFTTGSVILYKTTVDSISLYSVTLKNNNSTYNENVIFHLGTKDEMLKNLRDLSSALEEGKKGDVFEFSASKNDYILSFDKMLGQRCFRVSKPHSSSDDFGRLFKSTIDDIIKYFDKN